MVAQRSARQSLHLTGRMGEGTGGSKMERDR
jgi:hypothetical protein